MDMFEGSASDRGEVARYPVGLAVGEARIVMAGTKSTRSGSVAVQVRAEMAKRDREAEVAGRLAIADRLGEDAFDDGAVLRVVLNLDGQPYRYAAIKAGGKWHVTGQRSESYLTWNRLKAWMVERGTLEQAMVMNDGVSLL